MGALKDGDNRDLVEDSDQVERNEGVSIFFGRRPMESVISSAVKRCSSIPSQFEEDCCNSSASPGAVARKAAFFDKYIRTVSLEKALAAAQGNGQATARSLGFSTAEPEKEVERRAAVEDGRDDDGTNQPQQPEMTEGFAKGEGSDDQEDHTPAKEELTSTGNHERAAPVESGNTERRKGEADNTKSSSKQKLEDALPSAAGQAQASGAEEAGSIAKVRPSSGGRKTGKVVQAAKNPVRKANPQVRSEISKRNASKGEPGPQRDGEALTGKRGPLKMPPSTNQAGAKSNGIGFHFRSNERAERRKQFNQKMEEKHSAREAEKNKIQAKTQEEIQVEIKEFRKALAFKATPMPSFYQEAQSKSSNADRLREKKAAPKVVRKDRENESCGVTAAANGSAWKGKPKILQGTRAVTASAASKCTPTPTTTTTKQATRKRLQPQEQQQQPAAMRCF